MWRQFAAMIRLYSLTFGLTAAVLLSASQVSAAQASSSARQPVPETPRSRGQVRVGSLTITPALRLVNIGVDTNVFNFSGTERRSPDFTTTVQPQLEALVKTSGFTLRMTSLADLVYYRKYASERSINPRIDTLIEQRLSSRVSLYGEARFGYSRTREGLEVDARARQLGGSGVAGVRLRGRKLELDLNGSYSPTRYANDARFMDVRLGDTLDRTTTGAAATLRFHATPYTAFTFGGDGGWTRFRLSPERDIDSNRAFVGLQFSPRAAVSGSAQFGYRVARSRDAATPDFSGFTPGVGLSYRLLDSTLFTFGARRDLEFSYQPDRPYYIFVTYEGSVRQAIAHVFDVGAGIQHSVLTYRSFNSPGVVAQPLTDDRVRAITGTIGFPVTRRARVELYVTEWQRLSDLTPYRTRRTGLQITIGRAQLGERGIFVNGLGR